MSTPRLLPSMLVAWLALATAAQAETPAKPSHAQPSSYAPREHSGDHVYGSPIETPVASHAPHHAPAHRVSRKTANDAHGAAARHKTPPSRAPRSAPRDSRPAGDH